MTTAHDLFVWTSVVRPRRGRHPFPPGGSTTSFRDMTPAQRRKLQQMMKDSQRQQQQPQQVEVYRPKN